MTTFAKTTWNEGAAPGISAAELNRIEQGIYDAHVEMDKLTKIAEIVVGTLVASVVFSSIPATYRSLLLIALARSTQGVAQTTLWTRFNGDAAGNYNHEQVTANGSTVSAAASAGATAIDTGAIPGSNSPAGHGGIAEILISDYARTNFFKSMRSRTYLSTADTAAGQYFRDSGGVWRSTAAITSITLFPADPYFATASVFTLYGLST